MTRSISASGRGRRAGSARAAALPVTERRARIVAAATPLLRRHGHEVTTRQIAEAAGIAEGTVFRAFPTKRAVLDAVLADACDLSETVAQIRALDPAAPLQVRIRSCAALLTDRLATMMDLMIALRMRAPIRPSGTDERRGDGGTGGIPGGTGRDEPSPAERHRRHARRQGEVETAIAELLAPDAARLSCSPERAAHLLRLLAFAGSHRLINDGDPLGADEIAGILLHGIVRPRPADRAPDERAPDERGLPPPPADG